MHRSSVLRALCCCFTRQHGSELDFALLTDEEEQRLLGGGQERSTTGPQFCSGAAPAARLRSAKR